MLVKATEVTLAKSSSPIEALTTRNQVPGKVTGVELGAVMAEVTVDVDGTELVAVVTRSSVERLGLAAGDVVVALVKATEVMSRSSGHLRHDARERAQVRSGAPGRLGTIELLDRSIWCVWPAMGTASPATEQRRLTPSEWTVLALVAERPTHGWAIACSSCARGRSARSGRSGGRSSTTRSNASRASA